MQCSPGMTDSKNSLIGNHSSYFEKAFLPFVSRIEEKINEPYYGNECMDRTPSGGRPVELILRDIVADSD
jgi:hypothetical protein